MRKARFALSRHVAIIALSVAFALFAMLFVGCTPSNSSSNSAKSTSTASSKAAASASASKASDESATEWLQESGESAATEPASSAAAEEAQERSSQSGNGGQSNNTATEEPGGGKAPGTRSEEDSFVLRDFDGNDLVRVYLLDGYDYFDTLSSDHRYVHEVSYDEGLGNMVVTAYVTDTTAEEWFAVMDGYQNSDGTNEITVRTEHVGDVDITWHISKGDDGEVMHYAWLTNGKQNVSIEYHTPDSSDGPDRMTEELFHTAILSIEFL